MQPPARHHRQADKLGDDSAESAIGKRLLGIGEDVFLLVALDEIDAIGMEAHLSQCRKEQVRARQAPNDRSRCPGRDAGGEERGRSAIDRAGAATRDFMQCAVGEPAAGQGRVDLRHLKREDGSGMRRTTFKLADALAKLGNYRIWCRL